MEYQHKIYLAASQATPMLVHPIKLSNHSLPHDKFFLLLSLNILILFFYKITVGCIEIGVSWDAPKYCSF